jgi:hypothetical protein
MKKIFKVINYTKNIILNMILSFFWLSFGIIILIIIGLNYLKFNQNFISEWIKEYKKLAIQKYFK